jgi:antitoxin (DNA-binding transcriptional repressor) of toxin-antitoxin stability system
MSTVVLEKLPQPVARAIQAGKRLRITHAGTTIATVEPQQPVSKASRRLSKKLTAREWIATVGGKLTARPDLDAARIVRAGRDFE